jgi:hypothetical protein
MENYQQDAVRAILTSKHISINDAKKEMAARGILMLTRNNHPWFVKNYGFKEDYQSQPFVRLTDDMNFIETMKLNEVRVAWALQPITSKVIRKCRCYDVRIEL